MHQKRHCVIFLETSIFLGICGRTQRSNNKAAFIMYPTGGGGGGGGAEDFRGGSQIFRAKKGGI